METLKKIEKRCKEQEAYSKGQKIGHICYIQEKKYFKE